MERTTIRHLSWSFIAVAAVVGASVADVNDAGAWRITLPVDRWQKLVLWEDELVAADLDAGLFLVDTRSGSTRTLTTRDGLPSNRIEDLTVDGAGDLWVGTREGGTARISRDGSVQLISSPELDDLEVQSLAADGDYVIYGTPNGARSIVDGATGLRITTEDGLLSNDVTALAAYDGVVWFGSPLGVTRFDRFANEFVVVNVGLNTGPQRNIRALHASDAGVVCANGGGAFLFNETSMEWERLGSGLTGLVRSIRRLGSSWYAVKADDTVNELADGTTAWVSYPEYTAEIEDLLDVALDADGELWLAGTVIDTLAMDGGRDAQLWSPLGGDRYVRGGLSRSWVQGIAADGDGGYWVGNAPPNGILTHVRADGDVVSYDRAENLGGGGLCGGALKIDVLRTAAGDIWASAFTQCVTRLRPGPDDDPLSAEYETFNPQGGDPLQSQYVDRMTEDSRGRVWFANSGEGSDSFLNQGVDVLRNPADPASPASWLKLTPGTSQLSRSVVRDIGAAPDGVMWFTLEGFGLQRWDTDGSANDGSLDSFDDPAAWEEVEGADLGGPYDLRNVRALAIGPDGSVWVGTTDEGVIHFLYDGFARSVESFQQGGLQGGMLSNTIFDVIVDRRDHTWVATDGGLNRIRRDQNVAEIDAWTTVNAFRIRQLDQLGFSTDNFSPLPGASCNRLAYDRAADRIFLSVTGGSVQIEAGRLVPDLDESISLRIYPNPARRTRTDIFVTGFSGTATVRIYDLQGIKITEKDDVRADQDRVWDLTDVRDQPVASGLYIVQLLVDGQEAQQAVLAVER